MIQRQPGKSKIAKIILRLEIDNGKRVHVVRISGRSHIVQKIKGQVCWVRQLVQPKPDPTWFSDEASYLYADTLNNLRGYRPNKKPR